MYQCREVERVVERSFFLSFFLSASPARPVRPAGRSAAAAAGEPSVVNLRPPTPLLTSTADQRGVVAAGAQGIGTGWLDSSRPPSAQTVLWSASSNVVRCAGLGVASLGGARPSGLALRTLVGGHCPVSERTI